MKRVFQLLKKGNVSAGIAAIGNIVLAIVKGIVAGISGNGTMFATAMHSLADAVNQSFVYTGSILAEMKPSKRFPTGFGRIINLFCMIAVIVVTVMAYETIKTGWELFQYPEESSNLLLNVLVLLVTIAIDGYVLYKTMKLIKEEANVGEKENLFVSSFKNAKKASPATKLVFYEDLVATLGALFAIIGIVLAQYFGILKADGLASILIGILMLYISFRVGYDNMIGLIGVAAPADVEKQIAKKLLEKDIVVDIYGMRVVQEGRTYHVDVTVELKKGLTLAEADDVKFELTDMLLREPNISDVVLGIIEDNDKKTWDPNKQD